MTQKVVDYLPLKCEPSPRGVDTEHNISQVEDIVTGTEMEFILYENLLIRSYTGYWLSKLIMKDNKKSMK